MVVVDPCKTEIEYSHSTKVIEIGILLLFRCRQKSQEHRVMPTVAATRNGEWIVNMIRRSSRTCHLVMARNFDTKNAANNISIKIVRKSNRNYHHEIFVVRMYIDYLL